MLIIKKTLLLLSCLACGFHAFSQKQANVWYFGTLAGVDFNSGSPVVLTNGALNTAEGCSAASDAAGNLLFYTDGQKVWNRNHVVMPNGSGLLGDPSTTQSALIVPNPGNANLYYIFTLPAEGSGNFNYSVVDMTLQSGNGDVTVKNTFLKGNVTEKLSAVYHCNGHDVWVAVHELGTNGYAAFLVTNSGISPAVLSHAGSVQTDVHGQMKFNTSGTAIACAFDTVITATPLPGTGRGIVDVCQFNNVSGVVSAAKRLNFNHQKAYGVEFSADGSKLYASYYDVGASSYVSQFDLAAASVQGSEALMTTSSNPDIYALQLAPDHKVYVTHEVTPFLDVINFPNNPAATASYSANAVNLDPGSTGTMCLLGLPGFIQSYFNTAFPNVPCSTPVTAAFQSSDTTICRGDCISFTDLSAGNPTGWSWTFQGATPASSNAQNPPTICYPSAGTYTVRLIVSNGSGSDTAVNSIVVTTASINAGGDATIAPGGSTPLSASGSVSGYTWSPVTGLSDPNSSNPVASPSVTTTYEVIGRDANGCTASAFVTVAVVTPCGDLFVPTGFSPNNDGQNELECVMGSCIVTLQFSIYDRWGEKVFESSDQTMCWDGRYRGKALDNGIFVYYLKATLSSGEEVTKKGNINLIR